MKKNRSLIYYSTILFLSFLLCLSPIILRGQPIFTDVTTQAGVDHVFRVFEGTFGGGAVVIDFNKDGWEDVFLAGGAAADQLLENQGDGTFRNVAEKAGFEVLDQLVTQGGASADVNRDGWPDLFITTIAKTTGNTFIEASNVLLINNRDGTFSDQSQAFGLTEASFSTGASFGDVNRDGWPDLYVSNYFDHFEGKLDRYGTASLSGNARPARDLFYINSLGNRFVETSHAYGIRAEGLTFQALWTDMDNDNDLDLLVANDFGDRATPNLIYRNDYPLHKFTEIGEAKNFNYGINGMGLGACDINMDGWLDYYVTNIQSSPFFINQGAEERFSEESIARGSGFFNVQTNSGYGVAPVSWGVNFFDVDHDKDQDLYITNGCLNPNLAPNPNLMLVNENGQFSDYGWYSYSNDHSIGRGSVVFDYDRDGDLDILVINQEPFSDEDVGFDFGTTRLLRNDYDGQNNWIQIRLDGSSSESSGIGSRVETYVGETMLIREIYGGSSHESQNSTIAHFGLGTETSIDSIVVKWPTGRRQVVTEAPINQQMVIREATGAFQNNGADNSMTIYPNPVKAYGMTAIQFKLDEPASWSLDIFNLLGQQISRLQTGEGSTGTYFLEESYNLSPGVYLVALSTSGFTLSKRLIVH